MASRTARGVAFVLVELFVILPLAALAIAWMLAVLAVLVAPLTVARIATWLCRARRAHRRVVDAWEWTVLVVVLLPWRKLDGTGRGWPERLEDSVRWPS